jgi:hypothetical protein
MVEGVMGLALLCMVLMLAAIISHMYINRIRALEASRHAAWICGNGAKIELTANKKTFYEKFFFDHRLIKWKHKKVRRDEDRNKVSGEKIEFDSSLTKLPKSWSKVKVYEDTVTYGMGRLRLKATPTRLLPFPFPFFKSDLPILGRDDRKGRGGDDDKDLMKTIGEVEGATVWPDVKDSKLDMVAFKKPVIKKYQPLIEDMWDDAK